MAVSVMPVWGPLACAQPEVTIVPLEEGLSSYRRTQRSVSKCSLRPSGDAQHARSLPHPCTAVCTAPPLLLHFRHSSNLWLFESALLNSRQVKEAETFFLQTRNRGSVKAFFNLGESHKLLSGFNTNLYNPLQVFWVVFIGKR